MLKLKKIIHKLVLVVKFLRFLTLFSVLFIFGCVSAPLTNKPLPKSSNIYQGVLSNGLRYIVMNNHKPKNRVYMRLFVNAGSLNDPEGKQGVANLLAHLAFYDTVNFPKNSITKEMQKIGTTYGREVNAITDYTHTVYNLSVLASQKGNVDKAFNILNEWSQNITITPTALETEKSLIIKNLTTKRNTTLKLLDKKTQIELAGSKYATHPIEGTPETVESITAEDVQKFYNDFYQPKNMVLVVVGRFDARKIINQIKKTFNFTKEVSENNAEIDENIDPEQDLRVATVKQEGIEDYNLEFSFFEKTELKQDLFSLKNEIIQDVLTELFNNKLQHYSRNHLGLESANFSQEMLNSNLRQSSFELGFGDDVDLAKQSSDLFSFLEELKQQGFSIEEFKQVKEYLHVINLRNLYINSGSKNLADNIIQGLSGEQLFIDKNLEYQLTQKILKSLTLDEINQALVKLLNTKAKLFLATVPDDEDEILNPTEIQELWQKLTEQPELQ